MQHLGLTKHDRLAFEQQLRSSHEIRVDVDLLDLDGHVISSVSPKLLDGQVLGDRHSFGEHHGPQRRLTLNLLDPGYALDVDTASPRDGTVYYDRQIRVHYNVRVPALGDWVSVPVFTGPPWKLQRTDENVYIEADDASVLGMGETWLPLHIKKGTPKIDAVERILSERCGFTNFRFPDRKARLAHPVSLHRRAHGWAWAQRIMASMDLHLYVDGRGVPTARQLPTHHSWTFNPGPGGEIIDPVGVTTSRDRFANVVKVIGRKPHGAKHRVSYTAKPPRNHPNSPWELARENGGVPYFKEVVIRNDHFRTDAECKAKAERVLKDRMRSHEEMTASILPWPHLEPGDMARLVTKGGHGVSDRIDTFTLPLGVDSAPPMTLGWFDKPAPRVGRVRR